jgi:hypothetical protein
MDIYDRWLEIKQKHRIEKHEGEGLRKGLRDVQEDLSCGICYSKDQVSEKFKEFWRIIDKIITEGLEVNGYNWVTIKKFNDLIFTNETDEEQRDKILRKIVWSLTYNGRPKFTLKGIMQVMDTVMKKCVRLKEDGSIIFRDREIIKTKLLGNSELVRYGYILDEKEKEERFQRFWEWYRNITKEDNGSILKQVRSNTIDIFIELIHAEEEIDKPENRWNIRRFQKSIVYDTRVESRFGKPWVSGELTDKIKDEFKRTCGFTEIIEETIISDLEEENDREIDNNETDLYEELIGRFGMEYKMSRWEVKEIEELELEWEIVLTEEFVKKWQEISNLKKRKRMEELRKWYRENVTNCKSCNEPRIKQYMYENEEKLIVCKDCLLKGSKEKNDNESDDMSIDIEIDNREIVIHKFEIERLKKLGFNKYHFTSEFVRKYKENEGEPDEDLKKILNKVEKQIEQKEEVTDKEDDSEEENNRKQKEKVVRLLKIAKERDIEVSERELSRLVSYEFNEEEIFSEGFIRKFQEIKNELESYIIEELGKFFDKQKKRIENDEEIELISNISENEGIEIVVDNKDEDENKLEKLINTDDFELFEESDLENLNIKLEDINNNNESDLSDYYIENLFEEIDNMAVTQDQVREDMRQAYFILTGHDIGNNWNALTPPAQPIFGAINNVNAAVGNLQDPVNRAARVGSLPLYYGEDEDPFIWIRDFNII